VNFQDTSLILWRAFYAWLTTDQWTDPSIVLSVSVWVCNREFSIPERTSTPGFRDWSGQDTTGLEWHWI